MLGDFGSIALAWSLKSSSKDLSFIGVLEAIMGTNCLPYSVYRSGILDDYVPKNNRAGIGYLPKHQL